MKKLSLLAALSFAAAALALMPDGASAQVPDTTKKDTAAVRPAPTPTQSPIQTARPAGAISDSAIIAMLQLSHTQQLAAAEMAAQRAQSPRVKRFAETLKNDHGQALKDLEAQAQRIHASNRGMPSGVRDPGAIGRRDSALVRPDSGAMMPDSGKVGRQPSPGRRDSALVRPDSGAMKPDSAKAGREPSPGRRDSALVRPDSGAMMPDSAKAGREPNSGRRDSVVAGQKPTELPEVSFDSVQGLTGHEFDHGFVRLQVQHNETEINHLRNDVIPMIKDSGLKALVQRALPILGRHLTEARELEAVLKTTN